MASRNSFWTDKTVCVTGGSGFLGYHIVQQLLAAGARVRVFSLAPPAGHPLWERSEIIKIFDDIRDSEAIRRGTAGCDVIFHTAGIVATWGPGLAQMHSVHVEGTRAVLEAAPRAARIVHTSTIRTIGASRDGTPLTEDSPFDLHDFGEEYVQTKHAAEQLALAAAGQGRDLVVTNPGFLVGPEDYGRSDLGGFCARFWKGRMPMAPSGGINLADVRDVAAGHLLAAEHGRLGRRYILGGENRSFRAFMLDLAHAAGMRPRALPRLPNWGLAALAAGSELCAWLTHKEPCPSFQHVRLSWFFWYVSSDRAAQELDYSTRPLETSLRDTYRWHCTRAEPRLRGLNRWWMRPAA
jgi:dihydroflavonol-4-reductase